jgi:hypothetical protein
MMGRGYCTFLLHLEGRVRSWPSFRLARDRTEARSRSRSSSRDVHRAVLTVTGWPASTDGLDGGLARLQQWPRWEDGPFAHAWWVAAPSWCGELSGVRALAAAAVRCRGKASGRRVVRRVPCGRVAPASCCAPPPRPCCVRGYAPPGARRAPRALEDVRKVLTVPGV